MKYKNLEQDYLILCLDRLTRFKNTNDKYERVFRDIAHKYNQKNIDLEFVKEVFNNSIKTYTNKKCDNYWNKLLQEEENKIFFQTEESKRFFPINLNIEGLLEIAKNKHDIPLNIKRLIYQSKYREKNSIELRRKYSLLFPLEKIILTEGATEEILLEEFANVLGFDFKKEGILVVGAGGKNQVAKKYYQMTEEVKLPIFILLDCDANETKKLIDKKLRKKDKVYLIKSGEFEDIIPKNILIKAVNNSFKNGLQISEKDFDENLSMVKNLKEIYRKNGFGDFQKADFAKEVKNILNKKFEIQGELQEIIKQIKSDN